MAKGPVMTMSRWEDAADWGRTTRGAARYRKYFYFDQSVGTRQAVSPLSCPTLCDPMDYRAHGILQARILEWVAFPFSRGSSQLTIKAFLERSQNPGSFRTFPTPPHHILFAYIFTYYTFSAKQRGENTFSWLYWEKKKKGALRLLKA